MAALSWSEVKDYAVRFSKECENETSEGAEAQSFLDGFLRVWHYMATQTLSVLNSYLFVRKVYSQFICLGQNEKNFES